MTSPAPVWEVINGFGAYWALNSALDLGIFDALAPGPSSLDHLHDQLDIDDPRDLQLLLQFLTALDLIDTDGTTWSNTEVADRHLTADAPTSMIDLVRLSPGARPNWENLTETLRRGRPDDTDLARTDELHPPIAAATAPTQGAVAAAVRDHLIATGAITDRPVTIVDLGCGSGAWLRALLTGAPDGSRGTGIDLPHVVDRFRDDLRTEPIDLIAGDYLETPTDHDHAHDADICVLAHVLRSDTESRAEALVSRALGLLRPGGTLAVADYFVPEPDQPTEAYVGARHDLTLALTMRAGTPGRGITDRQLTTWCDRHGASLDTVLEPVPRQTVHLFTNRNPNQGQEQRT